MGRAGDMGFASQCLCLWTWVEVRRPHVRAEPGIFTALDIKHIRWSDLIAGYHWRSVSRNRAGASRSEDNAQHPGDLQAGYGIKGCVRSRAAVYLIRADDYLRFISKPALEIRQFCTLLTAAKDIGQFRQAFDFRRNTASSVSTSAISISNGETEELN